MSIYINADDTVVRMEIRDNGRGFSADDANFDAGMGLDKKSNRVTEMDGTFHDEVKPKAGTTIIAVVPLTLGEVSQAV